MRLSYVILTHNRRESLLRTLRVLIDHTPLDDDQWEAIVVDNASTDGTAEAVCRAFPHVKVVQRPRNEGSPARNEGVRYASGDAVIFLDDDSYPCGETSLLALDYLNRHERVGMVGGRVLLPDGGEDGAALPIVLPACAMCVRREAFESVGGFDEAFFRQAEEYDLIIRLLAAGWDIRRDDAMVYRHEKVTASRSPALIQKLDLQNNLILAARYLPRELCRAYRGDWIDRYAALARHAGNGHVVGDAVAQARRVCANERHARRSVLDPALIEVLFQQNHQRQCVQHWALQHNIYSVVIAEYTKNLLATWRACRDAGLHVAAICDDHPAYAGMDYRGAAIVSRAQAAEMNVDGVVLSNINPAQVNERTEQLSRRFDCPVLQLWSAADAAPGLNQQQDHWRREQYPRLAV